MNAFKSVDAMVDAFKWNVERGDAAMAKWAAEFIKAPSHTLSWSEQTFMDAAMLDVTRNTLAVIENARKRGVADDVILPALANEFHEKIMTNLGGGQSTSATSNLALRANLKAWRDMLEMCGGKVR